tara:strand:+ start:276 stop:797 length:522 start_codon:yes stop_codon:yes gene_type:complete
MKKLAIVLGLGVLIACGGNEKKETKATETKKEVVTEEVEAIEEVVEEEKELVEITVAALGESMAEIAFEPKSISVPANSRVKLTFENKSSADGMFHNFVLVELGSGAEIATAGIKAGIDNNFVPDDKRIFASTTMSKMGETLTIEFDAPAKGSYHYVCTYPGHTNMIGRFNVE